MCRNLLKNRPGFRVFFSTRLFLRTHTAWCKYDAAACLIYLSTSTGWRPERYLMTSRQASRQASKQASSSSRSELKRASMARLRKTPPAADTRPLPDSSHRCFCSFCGGDMSRLHTLDCVVIVSPFGCCWYCCCCCYCCCSAAAALLLFRRCGDTNRRIAVL